MGGFLSCTVYDNADFSVLVKILLSSSHTEDCSTALSVIHYGTGTFHSKLRTDPLQQGDWRRGENPIWETYGTVQVRDCVRNKGRRIWS